MKRVAIGLLVVIAVCIAWNARQIVVHFMKVDHWVALMIDVDHRMEAGDFPDLNSDNIRSLREASSIRDGDFNVVLLGDSYVFGFLHRNIETTPPSVLERLLRDYYKTDAVNVWNFGWTSSSPYLSLRLLQDIGAKYKPDLVILNLDMTDFKDDFFYRQVIHGEGLYRYARKHPRSFFHVKGVVQGIPFLRPLHQRWFGYPAGGDYFVARQPMRDSMVHFNTVRDSLDQISRYSRDVLNARFVVFIPPRHWQYTDRESPDSWERPLFDVQGPYAMEPFRYVEGVQSSLDYPLVSLLADFQQAEAFPLNFKGDSHWNAKGAKLVAEAFFRHCEALGCFEPLDQRFGSPPSDAPESGLPATELLAPPP